MPRRLKSSVYRALAPESRREAGGVRARILLLNEGLAIRVEADDVSDARAAVNSYLRLIEAARGTLQALERG